MRNLLAFALGLTGLVLAGCGNTTGPAPAGEPAAAERVSAERRAPGGTVRAEDGSRVELASAWSQGNAVIVFYRGHW